MATLKAGGTSVDAVEIAIRVLEDDSVTNCGYGSNLNFDGVVEADASIMDSFGRTGAVGATPQIKNPISLSRLILERSSQPMTLKRVPPNFVVGEGAVDYAREQSFPVNSNESLVAHPARIRFSKWQKEIEYQEIMKRRGKLDKARAADLPPLGATSRPIQEAGSALPPAPTELPGTPQLMKQKFDVVTDTVGAISIDRYGNMAAGSSSGGIGMKQPGRVGPAALIGVGTYVKDRGERQVGTVVSGTGEHMLHTLISAQAVNRLYDSNDELDSMKTIINEDFMGAQGFGKANIWGEPAIGIMSVKAENVSYGKRLISFIFGHNTDSFEKALASMTSNDSAPKTIMSRVTREPKLAVGGSSRLVQMQIKYTDLKDLANLAKATKKEKDKTARRAARADKKTLIAPPPPKLDKKQAVVGGMESLHIDGRDDDTKGSNPVADKKNAQSARDSGKAYPSDWLIDFDGGERSHPPSGDGTDSESGDPSDSDSEDSAFRND
ncbi:L-asparaginase [Dactylellina cionopaga]|nr:L-asparaginase [Dactylellina cionopaga]